jgi:hypothetical protein
MRRDRLSRPPCFTHPGLARKGVGLDLEVLAVVMCVFALVESEFSDNLLLINAGLAGCRSCV